MPCDYSKYPPNWKTEIRPRILERAKNCCETCGVKNNIIIRRYKKNPFQYTCWNEETFQMILRSKFTGMIIERDYLLPIKIILTIAHLDHDPKNWNVKDERLKALCQRCHLLYDREERRNHDQM